DAERERPPPSIVELREPLGLHRALAEGSRRRALGHDVERDRIDADRRAAREARERLAPLAPARERSVAPDAAEQESPLWPCALRPCACWSPAAACTSRGLRSWRCPREP